MVSAWRSTEKKNSENVQMRFDMSAQIASEPVWIFYMEKGPAQLPWG